MTNAKHNHQDVENPVERMKVAALPKSIRPVGEHLGFRVARTLINNFPGAELYIPKVDFLKKNPDHFLMEVLGEEMALQLASIFTHNKIDIPVKMMTTAKRRNLIHALFKEGKNNSQIAMDMGMTRSGVKRIRKNYAEALLKKGSSFSSVLAETGMSKAALEKLVASLETSTSKTTTCNTDFNVKFDGHLTRGGGNRRSSRYMTSQKLETAA